MSVRWNKILETGYKEIDDEHREVIDGANGVFKAIKIENIEEITEKINDFVEHITEHFASEEEIMAEVNLPGFKAHKKLHENYLVMVSDVIERFDAKKSIPKLKKDFKMLCNAMIKHIVNYDQPAFVKIKELQQSSIPK